MNETLQKLLGTRESLLTQLQVAEGFLISTPMGYLRFCGEYDEDGLTLSAPIPVMSHLEATRFMQVEHAEETCRSVNEHLSAPVCVVVTQRTALLSRLAVVEVKIEALGGRAQLPGMIH